METRKTIVFHTSFVHQIALMYDPYAVAWKMKNNRKLIDDTVGYLPKELSRAAWFFMERKVKISGTVFEEKYRLRRKKRRKITLEVELKIEG